MKDILKYQCILLIFCFSNTILSQVLNKHLWDNRVVLIISKSPNNSNFKSQQDLFNYKDFKFKDRKLVIYNILPESYMENEKSNWIQSKELFNTYNSEKSDFKVVLIGLDGGIKLKSYEVLSTSNLFAFIDKMPMRRREIGQKNKN